MKALGWWLCGQPVAQGAEAAGEPPREKHFKDQGQKGNNIMHLY